MNITRSFQERVQASYAPLIMIMLLSFIGFLWCDTIYVEADYSGFEDGSFEYPFSSIQRAIGNIDPESDNEIIIRAGVQSIVLAPCSILL